MELAGITYRGPDIGDRALLDELPANLRGLLEHINGFIQFHGGLHLRGTCESPSWHSIRRAWKDEEAFHRMYAAVKASDIPFAQDCVGDQFLLRRGAVYRLHAESVEVERMAPDLATFLAEANENPIDYLQMQPLLQLMQDGNRLEPGQLIHAFPPFCSNEAAEAVSLRAVPAEELHSFHAELAAKLPADGGSIQIVVGD